ncbi:MAG: cobalamin-dependent protein [Candidatus Woesearchaeota archaeon]
MKKVILINPKIKHDFFFPYDCIFPPLDLLTLASHIRESYIVKIIDMATTNDWKDELSKLLDKEVICVGVTVQTIDVLKAVEVSKFVKEKGNYYVVCGGIHPTLFPWNILKKSWIC